MEKVNGWIFIVIAILLLLPLIGLNIGVIGDWLIVIAFALVGIFKLMNKQ